MQCFSPANGILLVESKTQPMKMFSVISFSPANGILLVESGNQRLSILLIQCFSPANGILLVERLIVDGEKSYIPMFQSRERDSIS